jgi:hypothetical protein
MPKLKKRHWLFDDDEDLKPDSEKLKRDAFVDPDAAMLDALEPFLAGAAIKFVAQLLEFNTTPADLAVILTRRRIAPARAKAILEVYEATRPRARPRLSACHAGKAWRGRRY